MSDAPATSRLADGRQPGASGRIHVLRDAERALLEPDRLKCQSVHAFCAKAGISERWLRDAFRRLHGTSPARHLRSRRLEQVREALLAIPTRRSPVKQAAMTHGFLHLGRFARIYRERFDELPSETVARAGGDSVRSARHVRPTLGLGRS